MREVAIIKTPLPRLVVTGSSRGGLSALSKLLQALPATLNAAVVVVQHLSPQFESRLEQILQKQTLLRVHTATDGRQLEVGHVYVAPPNFHVTVSRFGRIRLDQRPPINHTRPAVDRLFESAAQNFGAKAIAVVLTGSGRDGADGAALIDAAGGTVFVQDEASAEDNGMISATIATGCVVQALSINEIAQHITRIATQA